jgi:inosine-uridine nucleoside N-ribohydrolase
MKLIVETDIGHDPDDFFAICYLIAAGVDIKAVLVGPGDPDQIAIAKFIRDACKLDFPIVASKLNREKLSSGSIHHKLLKKYKLPLESKPDGYGPDIIKEVYEKNPDVELFVIGPATSIGIYLRDNSAKFSRSTMQGGFLPYSLHYPTEVLEKFLGKMYVPTFNLNGDRKNGQRFIDAEIKERRFVGKNLCHTIVYDKDLHERLKPNGTDASNLFKEASAMYLEKHDSKKFHDPTAAVCHLHSKIAVWYPGVPEKHQSGWTTRRVDKSENSYVAADIDRETLWDNLTKFV